MAAGQELQAQEKRELQKKEEGTTPARVFLPTTDIYETDGALNVVMECRAWIRPAWTSTWKTGCLPSRAASTLAIPRPSAGLYRIQHRQLSTQLQPS